MAYHATAYGTTGYCATVRGMAGSVLYCRVRQVPSYGKVMGTEGGREGG